MLKRVILFCLLLLILSGCKTQDSTVKSKDSNTKEDSTATIEKTSPTSSKDVTPKIKNSEDICSILQGGTWYYNDSESTRKQFIPKEGDDGIPFDKISRFARWIGDGGKLQFTSDREYIRWQFDLGKIYPVKSTYSIIYSETNKFYVIGLSEVPGNDKDNAGFTITILGKNKIKLDDYLGKYYIYDRK